ncbi:relaxase domain-containing protein [Streptomyces sp. SD31]|uniref:relaxase domain-containing protein n=1 Tax=Streptomyces sp. SD31 TaxID=3452208 RepID=UPI003F896B1C
MWGALDTVRLYQHVVAAGTLYTLAMTTEVCEELGLATVPREVTPGLRPVMEIAGVDSELIDWSSTRRQRIEDVLEGLTYKYAQKHGRLPGERARQGLAWWAAQETRPEKKTPRPLKQLLAWWRASALLKFGKQVVDGLLQRCRTADAAIRAQGGPGGGHRARCRRRRCGRLHRARHFSPAVTSWPKPAVTCWRPCAARSSRAAWTTTSPTAPCPTTRVSSPFPSPAAGPRPSR